MTEQEHLRLHKQQIAFASSVCAFALTVAFALIRLRRSANALQESLTWTRVRVSELEDAQVRPARHEQLRRKPRTDDLPRPDPFRVEKA